MEKEAAVAQTRNFMLPSYHEKTHYKAARSIHMQVGEQSLLTPEHVLRGDFQLNIRAKGEKPPPETFDLGSQFTLNTKDAEKERDDTETGLDPKGFARVVLQNCGQIRLKDPRLAATSRGTDFMRKLAKLRSPDPALTFFGSDCHTPFKTYGLPGATSAATTPRGFA